MGVADDLLALSEEANEALGKLGIERAAIMLSEGYCPICTSRSSPTEVVEAEPDDDDGRVATAVVNCASCMIRWRSGSAGEGHWLEHSRAGRGEDANLTMTITLNPPEEIPRNDEFDWEDVSDE